MKRIIRSGWSCVLAMVLAVSGGCSLDIARGFAVNEVIRLASTMAGSASTALLPALLQSLTANPGV